MNDTDKRTDRTVRAVTAQIHALGCQKYEIGVKAVQGSMALRTWSASEIQHGIAWLKAVNARDHDIYIRGAGSTGLILIDDLNDAALTHLKEDGLAPAVVIETSPKNFQVWVRLSQEQQIAPALATAAARILAERYGGDPNSADFRHFGRLVGFTNRKPKHRQTNGMQPYVLLHEAHGGGVAKQGADILHEAEARLKAAAETQPVETLRVARVRPPQEGSRTPAETYAYYAAWIQARYPDPDYSRLDWMIACDIASASLDADERYLAQVLLEGSPRLAERKAGHVEDYAARTARKARHDPEVISARERMSHSTSNIEAEAQRGM